MNCPYSLYVHFPFCLYKCHYCDFNSYATPREKIPFAAYSQALSAEMARRSSLFLSTGKHFFPKNTRLDTIFFGGGTPSLLPAAVLEHLLKEIGKYFVIDNQTEITLEANPGTVDAKILGELKSAGVNRLSLGIQSLHDAYLGAFGRIHTADEAREAIDSVSTIFDSNAPGGWSTDFIFGFPGQTLAEWREELSEIITFNPPHLSCYAFTVEKDAPYARMAQKGSPLPDEDLQADMLEETRHIIEKAGYDRYEISNFCHPGFQSRHNLNYWDYGPFLGIGAGAASFFHDSREGMFGYRTMNAKRPEEYILCHSRGSNRESIDSPLKTAGNDNGLEPITKPTAMAEFMMMGLRLKQGINRQQFEKLFGVPVESAFPDAFAKAREKGWMDPKNARLTGEGVTFSNQVITSFFP